MSQKEALLRALEIIDENEELYYRLWATEVEKISDHIGLRKIRDADGEWQLDIVVGVDATKHELTQNLGTILDKQNQLAKAQGVDLTEYFSELLRAKLEGEYTQEYKMVAVEGGIESKPIKKSPSWNLLAWDANFDLLLFLIGMSKPKQNNINILYGYLFRALLKSFGFSEFDIDTWREFGFDQLGENICPWDICVQPIHREKMRLKVEHLKERHAINQGEKRVYRATEKLKEIRRLMLKERYWDQASDLLKKTYPKSYRRYEKRLNAGISELVLSLSMKPIDEHDTTSDANNIEK